MTALAATGFFETVGRNWAAISIALTCLSLLLFAVLVLAKYVKICLNLFMDTPPPVPANLIEYDPILGEIVRFRSFDGTSLRGMWIRPPKGSPARGTVVFCHEFGLDMFSCARYARPLIEAGFTVFTFDFRGHGESSCPSGYRPLQWASDKELSDALGAIAYVTSQLAAGQKPGESNGEPSPLSAQPRVGVFGVSRGACTGILAASASDNVVALVCDGAFSTDVILTGLMKRWAYIFARIKLLYENHPDWFWNLMLFLLMRFAQPKLGCRFPSVRKILRRLSPRPILYVHGQRDSYVREEHPRMLLDLTPGADKVLWIVPHARHNQSVVVAPEEYARRTVAFFRKYLAEEEVDARLITGEGVDQSSHVA